MKPKALNSYAKVTCAFLGAASLLLISSYLVRSNPQNTHKDENITIPKSPFQVLVKSQPDSPLLVSLSKTQNFPEPEIDLLLQNKGDNVIRAYTIGHEVVSSHSKAEGVNFRNLRSVENLFQPHQSVAESIEGFTQPNSEPIEKITVYVDFVEFDDGTTWGQDKSQSAELLAGQRAGARAALEYLNNSKKEGGVSALAKIGKLTTIPITPPPNHSAQWLEGFRSGASIIQNRFQSAINSGNLNEAETVLRKPFDTSERR
jgi:hypothetical protein